MAHESFEDVQIAALLNENFISIKVDREERSDIDAVYMEATTALTGAGGWPMSVFCTPDGRPFYAGTYFPPTPRYGRPSFPQVVTALADAWRNRREEVVNSAGHIVGELARLGKQGSGESAPVDLDRAYAGLVAGFDAERGGFGGAPKFPPTLVLDALARGDAESLRMVDKTLRAMIAGGLHDQLGGGFARYSVDADWVVPHFEKMLFDNALLLGTLSRRWGHDGDDRYASTARLLADWLEREMRTADGAYASSLDADSLDEHGRHAEGVFYVWTRDQLRDVLGEDDAAFAAMAYSVTQGGTFEHGASTLQAVADADPERLESVRQRLFQAREARVRPARDDKVVAVWNGLLIDALVSAAMILDEPGWLTRATEAAEQLWAVHWVDRRLRRTSRDGVAVTPSGTSVTIAALRLVARLGAAPAGSVVVAGEADQPGIGLLEGRQQPGAYVCRDFACRRPVSTAAELRANSEADPDRDRASYAGRHDRCHRQHRCCPGRPH